MKILVVYASQTGQMRDILESITSTIADAEFEFAQIKLKNPYPFPWSKDTFFDVMPEAFLRIPEEIEPMPAILNKDYDLVIFGYQPWFLAPSVPTTSFLRSEWARALAGKPIVTVIGCRNMWLNAQENVKEELNRLNAQLVGHIVLEDRHDNLVSLRTTIKWLFNGHKKSDGKLPDAGVSTEEIAGANKYGIVISKYLKDGKIDKLQPALLEMGAITLRPNLIVMERRGVSQYPSWAKRAREKGGRGSAERKPVINLFSKILIAAIFVLNPFTSFAAKVKARLQKAVLKSEVDYFKSVSFVEGKM